MTVFALSAHFNDSYAFYGREDLHRCPVCGNLTHKWDESLVGLRIRKRRKFDISATYDGVLIVSEKFVQLCKQNGFQNVAFLQLPDDPTFYAISSGYTVVCDRHKVRVFEGFCETCGQYDAVAGSVCLQSDKSIPERSFAQTDVEFGSGDEKHPVLLCDSSLGKILLESDLRGLEIEPIKS